jgi:uncharacterized protein YggE
LGAKLGLPRQITTTSIGFEPPMPYAPAEIARTDAGAAETYQAGLIEITAQVTAEFDLVVEH